MYSHAVGGQNRLVPGPETSLAQLADGATVVDPLAVSLATPGCAPSFAPEPPIAPASPGAPAAGGTALDAVLAAEVLQRVAWGGDRRRGVARLELGGELAGAVVVVRGEGREISLELSLPGGARASALPERLSARLAARGLVVRELVVR